jgi:hypothetical protein
MVMACAPLVVAAAAAVADGWRPVGDDATISVLAHDVLSTASPLVGMPSTIGLDEDEPIEAHHPGPMEFWALALPARVAHGAPGALLIGVALVNATAIATIGVTAHRTAGFGAAVGLLVVVAVLMWGLGRHVIASPWNPYISVLPLIALFVLVWAALAGRPLVLWAVAAFASFVAQAHLVYAPMAVVVFACAVIGVVITLVQRARTGAAWTRDAVVVSVSTIAVLLAAWALPISDELANSPGNFSLLRDSWEADTDGGSGAGYATRVLVESIGAPPLFARQAASVGGIAPPWSGMSTIQIVTATIVMGALVAGTVAASLRRDRVAAAAGLVAVVVTLTAGFVVARLAPTFTGVPRYRLLQCWAVGGFVWFATGFVIARAIAHHAPRVATSRGHAVSIVGSIAAGAVLLTVSVAIVRADSDTPPDSALYDAVDTLGDEIAPHLSPSDPYRLELSTSQAFTGYGTYYGTFRELLRRGYDVRVDDDDPYLARSHTAPDDAERILLVVGSDALGPSEPGAQSLTRFVSATPSDLARKQRAAEEVRSYLHDESRLTEKGQRALEQPPGTPDEMITALASIYAGSADPAMLVDRGEIAELVLAGYLDTDVTSSDAYRSYVEARHVTEDLVFAAYLLP